jgi:asparagine synthase (glutamine-hydrolysing)
MCGINGFFYNYGKSRIKVLEDIKTMNNSIVHRGPDGLGEYTDVNNNFTIALGMRRLSIIDLENGSQPIISESNNIVIVFNGEIYNYKILRKYLEQNGIVFSTNSDTEVILKLYEFEGHGSFGKLDGMFAFSIYDKSIGKIFIARDFFGEKPLYFS